jgi:putative glutamine amidotransferase
VSDLHGAAPVIAVTTWERTLPTYYGDADLFTLGTEYAQAVRRSGGVPVLVPTLDGADVDRLLDVVDGVLLSGGQDVGGSSPADRDRDATERALIAGALAREIPVFGICRGLQILNVVHGGTLVDDLPDTPDHPHVRGADQLDLRHPVSASAQWLQDALPDDGVVNSIHHQAVDRLGDGLRVVALAPDGVVEAVEATSPTPYLRAVQWHPEKMPGSEGDAHAERLLADFIAAAAVVAGRQPRRPSEEKE